MDHMENDMYETKDLSTEVHKSFLIHFGLWRKSFSAYLCSDKYNKINICHSDIHKHVSEEKGLE